MATLTIHTDIDCNIYIDTEFHGIAKANMDYVINVCIGVYWIECRSIDDKSISYDFDFLVNDSTVNVDKNIHLLNNLRFNQLRAQYDLIGDFENGFAKVEHKGKLVGYIDSTYQFRYDDINVMSKELLCVKHNGHYGVLKNGVEIVPIKYQGIDLIGGSMLRFKLNDRFCLASSDGVKLTPLKYKDIVYVNNDIYALHFDKWYFVDSNIKNVCTPDNVILYCTSDGKVIDLNERMQPENNRSCKDLFGQEPIINCCKEGNCILVFNEELVKIGDEAFDYIDSLTSVTIPNSVTKIGHSAFSNCDNLVSITIPDSITTIGERAFCGCSNIIEFKGKYSSSDGRCLIVDGVLNSFAIGCGAIEYIIPSSVTKIGNDAFSLCKSLTSVTIPDSVTAIGDGAFAYCDSLTSITIPSNVTVIGSSAFWGCKNLSSITIPEGITEIAHGIFNGCKCLTDVTIPNSITTIREWAFAFCTSLTNVTIPENINTIEANAFWYCDNLKEFKGKYISRDGRCLIICNTIIAYAKGSGTDYSIPNGVTKIGESAFHGCEELTSITIPDSITSIGDEAFRDCCSLTSVTIPNSVTKIGKGVFYDCTNLTSITIANSVTEIGNHAFSGCDNLISITIPSGITGLQLCSFSGCKNIDKVYVCANTPPTYYEIDCINCRKFKLPFRLKIYVPITCVNDYKNADGWKEYADQIIGYDFENEKEL